MDQKSGKIKLLKSTLSVASVTVDSKISMKKQEDRQTGEAFLRFFEYC